MKPFTNASPKDLAQALTFVKQAHADGKTAVFAGGGSDLLGQMKERIVTPDVLVRLASIKGLDQIKSASNGGITIGGQITLDALSRHTIVRERFTALAEASQDVATPQIRNVATLAGNLCQRPWCWYYRNGFKCFKAGGNTCYSVSGENEFHAIFGGGPSYIVHPSDTAPALVALGATFHIAGPGGAHGERSERLVPAGEFFTVPTNDASRENVLKDGEVLASITLPQANKFARSTYHKIMDREAWTHAVVSAAVVLHIDKGVCTQARVVLGGVAPIPWRLPEVEKLLTGQKVTPALAAKAGEVAVTGARPLAKNGYKVPLTQAMVKRTLEGLMAKG